MKYALLLFMGLALIGCSGENSKKKEVMTREVFKALVAGKTHEQVLEAVGEPDSKQEGDGVVKMWYFKNKTKNTVTGKIDSLIQIVFKPDVVEDVNWSPRTY